MAQKQKDLMFSAEVSVNSSKPILQTLSKVTHCVVHIQDTSSTSTGTKFKDENSLKECPHLTVNVLCWMGASGVKMAFKHTMVITGVQTPVSMAHLCPHIRANFRASVPLAPPPTPHLPPCSALRMVLGCCPWNPWRSSPNCPKSAQKGLTPSLPQCWVQVNPNHPLEGSEHSSQEHPQDHWPLAQVNSTKGKTAWSFDTQVVLTRVEIFPISLHGTHKVATLLLCFTT